MWHISYGHAGRLRRAWHALVVSALVVIGLAGCMSTTRQLSEGERIAQAMEETGADMVNLRPVPLRSREAEKITENLGFDIPGIALEDKPAGTIRVYRQEKDAKFSEQLFKVLGKPGPATKLDYVAVLGTHELVLDHRLPEDVARRYISAFRSNPEGGG